MAGSLRRAANSMISPRCDQRNGPASTKMASTRWRSMGARAGWSPPGSPTSYGHEGHAKGARGGLGSSGGPGVRKVGDARERRGGLLEKLESFLAKTRVERVRQAGHVPCGT